MCTVLYCTVLLPPGVNPIAVNKYIRISYQIHCLKNEWRRFWPVITHKVKHEDSKTGVAGGMTLCHLVSVVSQKA